MQQQSPQQLQQQHCVVETTPVVRAGRALKGAPQQLQQSPALLMAYFLQLQAVHAPVLVEAQAEAVEVLGVPVRRRVLSPDGQYEIHFDLHTPLALKS